MKQMFVDFHCDTLLTTYLENKSLQNASGHINLEKLVNGGALLQCFAAFVPMHETAAQYSIQDVPWVFCTRNIWPLYAALRTLRETARRASSPRC